MLSFYPPMDVIIETRRAGPLWVRAFVKGDHRTRSFADCVERFMAAASAARPLPAVDLARFRALVEHLEDVKDAAEMMALLGGDRP